MNKKDFLPVTMRLKGDIKKLTPSHNDQLDSAFHFSVRSTVKSSYHLKNIALLFLFLCISIVTSTSYAAIVTWDGGGGDNNWNTCANWDPLDTCPTNVDVATFNATSTKNATTNVDPNVAGIDIQAGYTGTVTQGSVINIGASGYSQAAGIFDLATSQPVTVTGNYTHSGGRVIANSSTITVSGDFAADFATNETDYNSAAVVLDGTGDLTINNLVNFWINGFNDLTVGASGQTTTLTNTLTVRNVLTVGAGEFTTTSTGRVHFTASGNVLVVDPNSTISITALKFHGNGVTQNLPPMTNNGYDTIISLSGTNTTVNQTGNIVINGNNSLRIFGDADATRADLYNTATFDLTVGGNIEIGTGNDTAQKRLDATNSTVNVGGDFIIADIGAGSVQADLVSIGSTVILNGGNQSLSGPITFNNLTKNVTSIASLTFDNTQQVNITGAMNFQGTAGNYLTLQSDSAGNQWDINPSGTRTVAYVAVNDSNNVNAGAIDATGNNNINAGNNTNWTFDAVDNFTWTGADVGNNDWNDPDNWFGLAVPGAGNTAYFTGAYNVNADINVPVNVAGIQIIGGYTGTITQQAGQTIDVGVSNYTQTSGIFVGGNSAIDINGSMFITDGTFTSTSGNLEIADEFTVGSTVAFTHNSGNVLFTNSNNRIVDVGTASFNHVELNMSGGNMTITGTFDVNGNLTLTGVNNIENGTITVAGDVTTTDPQIRGSGKLLFDGVNQTLQCDGLVPGCRASIPGIEINNTGTLTVDDTIELSGSAGWTLTGGTADLTTNSAIIIFDGSPNKTVSDSSTAFGDVELDMSGGNLTVIGTMDVDGDLTITAINNIFTGTIAVSGNVTTTDSGVDGSATILFDGVIQTLQCDGLVPGCTGALPGLEVNNPGGVLTIDDTISIDGSSGWTFTAGSINATANDTTIIFNKSTSKTVNDSSTAFNNVEFDMSGGSVTVTSTMDINGDLTITGINNINGGTINLAGDLTSTDGGVDGSAGITLDGGNAQSIDVGSGDLPDGTFTVAKSANTATLISNLTLDDASQDLMISSGTLDLAGSDLTLTAAGDIIVVANGATLQLQGGETVTASSIDAQSGSTVAYNGAGTYASLPFGNNYHHLTFNGSGSWTPAAGLSVSGALTITAGTFEQTTANVTVQTGGSVSIGASGVWNNESTGNVTLGGNLTNAGTITLDSSGGTCGHADDITVSSTDATQRIWNGAGTFNFYDLNVSNQGGTLTTYSSTDSGGNGWTFDVSCGSNIIWDGGGAANNWSEAANWLGDVVPNNSQIAVFNSTSTKNAIIDTNQAVGGININADYAPGTVSQASTITLSVGSSGFIQSGSSFIGGDSDISIDNILQINGGTFTATSGAMTISDDFSITAGTFNHNSGTVIFTGGGNGAFIFDVSPLMNNVVFNRTNRIDITGTAPTLDIDGNFTMTNSTDIDGGTISMAGNISTTDSFVTGNSAFTVDGNNIQTIDGGGITAALPNLVINKSGGSLTFLNDISFNSDFTYTAGSVDTTTNDVTIQFGLTGANSNSVINSGVMQFNHVTLNKTNRFDVGGTMDINGNLTINSAFDLDDIGAGDKITLAGNLISNDATIVGTVDIEFDGTTDQTINIGSNDLSNGPLIVNKASGTLRLLSNLDLSLGGNTTQDLTITQGILDLNGFNLAVPDIFTIDANGTLALEGAEVITYGSQTLNAGSTVIYDGTAGPYTVKDWDYQNLTFNGFGAVFSLGANEAVSQNLSIANGIFNLDGFDLTVTGTFSNDDVLRLRGTETVSLTNDVDSGSVDYNGTSGTGQTHAVGNNYYNLSFNGVGGVWDQSAAVDVNNTLNIVNGTLDSAGNDINVAGDWMNTGSYTSGANTVTLDGTNQTIVGSTTFNNLNKVTGSDTLTFQAGSTQTVSGLARLQGSGLGTELLLRSDSAGSRANVAFNGTTNFTFLDVQDSNASTSTVATPLNPANSVNSGNTLAWFAGVVNAVTSVIAEITPTTATTSTSSYPFIFHLLPTINGGDSGMNQAVIAAPAGYTNFNVSAVSAGGSLTAGASCPTVGAGEYCASFSGQDITIDFGTAITTTLTPVQISFSANIPAPVGGSTFTYTVDDTATIAAPAQTGTAGDADGNAGNDNSLTVTLSAPNNAATSAVAEITPSTANRNTPNSPFSLHLLPTIGGSDDGINRTIITAPTGYTNFNVTAIQVATLPLALSGTCPTPGAGEYCSTIAGQNITVDLGTTVTTTLTPIQIDFTSDTPNTLGTGVFSYAVDNTTTPITLPQTGTAGDADGDTTNSNNLVVTLSSVDANLSSFTISPEIIIADGISTGTLAITLLNNNGTPVSGKTVVISSSRGTSDTIVQPLGVTNINGYVEGTISSSTVGSATLTAINTTDGITLTAQPQAHFTQGQVLTLTKRANKDDVMVGDLVTYSVEVKNSTTNNVAQVRVEDIIPDNFKYRRGSTLLNGAPVDDPTGNRTLTFTLGTVPALIDTNGNTEADPGETGYFRFDYQLIVGAGATPGDYTNTAVAKDSCTICAVSNSATADVSVTLDPLFDLGTIIGKVFHDKNGDNWQDEDEPGIAGVMVVLDEGTYALTDSHGRYHFPAVTPGERLLKINRTTLPSGATLNGHETQVVSVTPGILAKANFSADQNFADKRIGKPGIEGLAITVKEKPSTIALMGNAELQTVIVNGSQATLPKATVRLQANGINSEVLNFNGKTLDHIAEFHTSVTPAEEVDSWELKIMTPDDKEVFNFNGTRAPPKVIKWNGYDNGKKQIEGGMLYHYQLNVKYKNDFKANSARRLFGVDQKSVIELNLSGSSFKSGNFTLSDDAKEMLKEAAQTLRRFPREKVVIEGHADSAGSDKTNLDLSRQRAEAAHAYLVEVEGISPTRLELQWFGEQKPIADNSSDKGRLLNRRVEMKGLVSDINRAKRLNRYHTRASAKINGNIIALDRLGRFSIPVESNKVLHIELSDSFGRSTSASLTPPKLNILQPKNEIIIPLNSDTTGTGASSQLDSSTDVIQLRKYRLIGKTEPGSLIEINGTTVPSSEDGQFEYPLELAEGSQTQQIVILDPQGFTHITALEMTSYLEDEMGRTIYYHEPVPSLKLNLPPADAVIKEGSYTLSGSTEPYNIVLINDNNIAVHPDGTFTHTMTLQKGANAIHAEVVNPGGYRGTIDHTIHAGSPQLFFMAFADGKFSQLNTEGYIQGSGQESASELYSEGRVAFYLKGKVKGKYLITAAFDTGQNELDSLFDDLDDDGSKKLLNNLDPDQYYPVYGDNSTIVYDTQSQGKFYLALDSDTIHGVIGNYKLNLSENELAAYRRTFYGGLFEYQSLGRTQFGAHDTVVRLFVAQTRQSHVRDEIRATGGSLYYLSQRDIVEGSEQVSLVVKDKNTGLTLSRTPQQQNIDYDIKYLGGRLLFTRPVNSTNQDDQLVNNALLAGNPVYIEVEYDYHVDSFEKSASGGHARQQISDRISLGATYVEDDLAGGQYELQGIDSEIRIMKNSRVIAEVAESSGNEGEAFISDDGGLAFSPLQSAQQSGQATKIATELDLGEFFGAPDRVMAGAYAKELDPGFQASGSSSDQGKQKSGADLMVQLTERNTVKLRHDQEASTGTTQPGSVDSVQQNSAQWQYKAESWSLTGEYHDQQSEDNTGTQLENNSLAATKLASKVTDKLEASITHQTTLEGTPNDQSSVGLKYQLTESLHLQGSATSGDKGDAGEARIGYNTGKVRVYLTERVNDDKSGRSTSTIVGGETSTATIAGADKGKVYSEYQWDNRDSGDKSLSLVGAEQQWLIQQGWKFNLSSEYSDINSLSGTISRTTVAVGLSYMRKGFKASTRNEIRNDRGTERKEQFLTTNYIEYNLNPDYTLLGKYRHSITRNLTTKTTDAEFDEQSIGLAYRPARHDRLNALARFTRLSDKAPLNLSTSTALTTRVDVLSVEWSYQITKNIEWADKQALRMKTEESDLYPEFETLTHLSIHRLNYALPLNLAIGMEHRTLTQKEADDVRSGWLSELTWRTNRHLRLGVGYNFTDFSDNEFSDNDYSTEGWFIRIQGMY